MNKKTSHGATAVGAAAAQPTSAGATAVGATTPEPPVTHPEAKPSRPATTPETTRPATKRSLVKRPASAQPEVAPPETSRPERPGAKNRPTPKRKDQEAARRRPLVETDRKAAKAAEKERAREARASQRAAADRGEDSALAPRDRGPEKRYIRDHVDARLSLGELAMPLMFVLILSWFILPKLATITLALVWFIVLAGLIDSALLWRRIKKGLLEKYGSVPRGSANYTITRSMQMRRLRFPRPVVKRGDAVR